MYVARADGDLYAEERAVAEIEEALKAWAFSQRADDQRRSWLRHVQRLVRAGLGERAETLIEFANSNARWRPIEPADLATSSQRADSAAEPSA
jgi:hypothetical protein